MAHNGHSWPFGPKIQFLILALKQNYSNLKFLNNQFLGKIAKYGHGGPTSTASHDGVEDVPATFIGLLETKRTKNMAIYV